VLLVEPLSGSVGSSKKQAFVRESAEVTLTVYNYEDRNAWESVVVTGAIHPVEPEDVSDRSAAGFCTGGLVLGGRQYSSIGRSEERFQDSPCGEQVRVVLRLCFRGSSV
jgi:hypothetical protein